tara:strand:+ start:710 stop:1060 length:351 start_codon:yes stop_codon:yes gene_type:complete
MSKPGLYANIHAKKARIAAGSGEKMRKVGSAGAPTKNDFVQSAKTAKKPKKVAKGGSMSKGSREGSVINTPTAFNAGGLTDLSGDGKVTQKDVLIGRGVIKRKGGGVAKRGFGIAK